MTNNENPNREMIEQALEERLAALGARKSRRERKLARIEEAEIVKCVRRDGCTVYEFWIPDFVVGPLDELDQVHVVVEGFAIVVMSPNGLWRADMNSTIVPPARLAATSENRG